MAALATSAKKPRPHPGESASSPDRPSVNPGRGDPLAAHTLRNLGNKALQRFSGIPARAGAALPTVRPKLTVNRPGDVYEREADHAADQVMRMTGPGSGKACACGGKYDSCRSRGTDARSPDGPIRLRLMPSGVAGPGQAAAPPQIGRVLGSPGRPLDAAPRAFMESRFGRDLGGVRIHTGAEEARSAKAISAYAYAAGSHIVFGADQYRPGTEQGRRLLAHEVAHTLQAGRDGTAIHRAEVEDRESVCAGLTDIGPDVNQFVNDALAAARAAPGVAPLDPFLEEVLRETGGVGAISPIETFIEGLPPGKRFLPTASLSGTRFSRLPNASGLAIPGISIPGLGSMNIYDAHASGFVHVVGSTARINGICAGADKLGHFFQQGAQYFSIRSRSTLADAESFGRGTEISRAGLGATGVYSNADLAANSAGIAFWEQLAANPAGLTFDIANFISDDWNEYINSNFYEPSVARQVWATQLTGRWTGAFGLGPALRDIDVDLSATPGGAVTGAFTYASDSVAAAPVTGTLTGTVRFLTTSVSGTIGSTVLHGGSGVHTATPVSGIVIDFDWVSGTNSGKGRWESLGEHRLVGTYGSGTANSGAGMFNIQKG